jgi:hypothetical protein
MSKPEAETAEHDDANDEVIGRALRRSLLVLGVVGLIVGGIVWWRLQRPVVQPRDTVTNTVVAPVKRRNVDVPPMPFVDVTKAAGIAFTHENGAYGAKLLPETMGSGCAFFDYDNDGDQDLLLINSQRWPWDDRPTEKIATMALYSNDGHGKFSDVTADAGLNVACYGMGVAAADYDGDSDVDLFITAVGKNLLLQNAGGKFTEVAADAGVAGSSDDWGTSCGFFDADNDGDLDLFVCHYVAWSKEADTSQDFRLVGGGRAYGRPQNFAGTFATLYRNEGDGTFRDVSKESGIAVVNPDTGVPAAKSLGVAFADFDADGYLDIVVANDTVANFLFHNQRDGTFKNVSDLSGVAYDTNGMARGAMGIDVAHFRNSDEQGIIIGNFSNEMTALYVSAGSDLAFRDDAVANGLGPATRLELKFGIFFFDADLDGRLDVFGANGHLEDDIQRVQATQRYAQPAHFFWNCGSENKSEFVSVPSAKCGDDLYVPMVGRGAAYADIDGDGDLDVVETASGGPARLLRNDQQLGHHWLRLRLVGKAPNTAGIGALVEVHVSGEAQRRLISPTRSYLSQCELPATFGLGSSTAVERVVIRWPGGQTQTLADLEIDREHVIEQP